MTVLSDQMADTYFNYIRERAIYYKNKGYSITIAPDPDQLPDFLREFLIHLVAKSESENVVVDVKSRKDLKETLSTIDKLDEIIKEHPGWRFELVLIKDELPPPVDVDAKALLEQVENLQKLGYSSAAFLLVWSALEIGLRNLAHKEDVPLEKDAADFVMSKLASWGWIENDVYNTLGDALPVRDAVAHGYQVSEDLAALVDKLLAIARTLV